MSAEVVDGTYSVSTEDWLKGISLSIAASIIGGASKLAIRKSWLLLETDAKVSIGPDCPDHHDVSDSSSTEILQTPLVNGCIRSPLMKEDHKDQDDTQCIHDDNSTDRNCQTVRSFDQNLPLHEQRNHTDSSICSKKYTSKVLRLSGMVGMAALNPMCSVLAMNYASPSILAPFSGLTLVWIVLFSRTLLGETPSITQVVGATWIVIGEIIVATFGDHTNNDPDVTIEDVKLSYLDPFFISFFTGLTAWLFLLTYWITRSRSPALRRFAWGVSGGTITGLQNFLKDVLTIVKLTNNATYPEEQTHPWMIICIFILLAVGTSLAGLLMLTACMKRYDATYSASMFVGSFVITATIMSMSHYHTFEHLKSDRNYIFYPVGIFVLMTGVFILATDESCNSIHNNNNDDRDSSVAPLSNESVVLRTDSTGDDIVIGSRYRLFSRNLMKRVLQFIRRSDE